MQTQATFTDYDFTVSPVWGIKSDVNNGYPQLKSVTEISIMSICIGYSYLFCIHRFQGFKIITD